MPCTLTSILSGPSDWDYLSDCITLCHTTLKWHLTLKLDSVENMENVTEKILSKSELAAFHKNTVEFFTSVLGIKIII